MELSWANLDGWSLGFYDSMATSKWHKLNSMGKTGSYLWWLTMTFGLPLPKTVDNQSPLDNLPFSNQLSCENFSPKAISEGKHVHIAIISSKFPHRRLLFLTTLVIRCIFNAFWWRHRCKLLNPSWSFRMLSGPSTVALRTTGTPEATLSVSPQDPDSQETYSRGNRRRCSAYWVSFCRLFDCISALGIGLFA